MLRKKRSVHRYTPYTPIYSTSNDLPDVSSWVEWKQFYQKELMNDKYGYETKFIDLVLSRINNINPSDVRYQYHFRDGLLSKNRYIDFLILNKDKGYCLAIELDGYGKMLGNATGDNKDYDKFNDFMIRQNSLLKALYNHNETSKFNIIILRYTNKYFLNNTHSVIREIINTLYLQTNLYKSGNKLVIEADDYKQQINDINREIVCYKENEYLLQQLLQDKEEYIKELETEISNYQYSNLPTSIIIKNGDTGTDCADNLDEKDLLIEKLKSENAKLKWIEMKYKELTEPNDTKEKDLEVVKRNEILRVMAEESLRDTDETVSKNEIIFTQKEKEALAEVFKNNNDEIDCNWDATRTALSKQPNHSKKKEKQRNSHWDKDNKDSGLGFALYMIIIYALLIILLVAMEK